MSLLGIIIILALFGGVGFGAPLGGRPAYWGYGWGLGGGMGLIVVILVVMLLVGRI